MSVVSGELRLAVRHARNRRTLGNLLGKWGAHGNFRLKLHSCLAQRVFHQVVCFLNAALSSGSVLPIQLLFALSPSQAAWSMPKQLLHKAQEDGTSLAKMMA